MSDDELLEMSFEALVPLANSEIKNFTQEDVTRAKEVLRFLTVRIDNKSKGEVK